jgi:hypothetical protein
MVNSAQAKEKFSAIGNIFGNGGLAASISAPPLVGPRVRADRRYVYLYFAANIFVTIFLQKLCFPGNLSVIFPFELASTAILVMVAGMSFSVDRLILYSLFIGAAIISQLLGRMPFSVLSLLMIVAIYAPLCVRYQVEEEFYRKCMQFFINCMLLISAIVWIEHVIQVAVGYRYWVNLDNIIPVKMQFKTYAYIHPLQYNGKYLEPNGIFFLEPSILSQFLAMALIIEFRIFRRWRNIILFGLTLLATFAGTGLFMVLACLPFLIPRISMRTFLVGMMGSATVAVVLVTTGWLERAMGRFEELGMNGRSGNERFVAPMQKLAEALQKPDSLFHGSGAGSIPIGGGEVWWPFTKDVVEYGLLMAVAFYVFAAWSVFKGARDIAIPIAALLAYSFLGGAPPSIMCLLVLCTLLRVKERA